MEDGGFSFSKLDLQQIKCELENRVFWEGSELEKKRQFNRNVLTLLLAQSIFVTLADLIASVSLQSIFS